jgi:hypothetical protein
VDQSRHNPQASSCRLRAPSSPSNGNVALAAELSAAAAKITEHAALAALEEDLKASLESAASAEALEALAKSCEADAKPPRHALYHALYARYSKLARTLAASFSSREPAGVAAAPVRGRSGQPRPGRWSSQGRSRSRARSSQPLAAHEFTSLGPVDAAYAVADGAAAPAASVDPAAATSARMANAAPLRKSSRGARSEERPPSEGSF